MLKQKLEYSKNFQFPYNGLQKVVGITWNMLYKLYYKLNCYEITLLYKN